MTSGEADICILMKRHSNSGPSGGGGGGELSPYFLPTTNHVNEVCQDNLSSLKYNANELEQESLQQGSTMKNVHFSPVVSQLRYPQQQQHHTNHSFYSSRSHSPPPLYSPYHCFNEDNTKSYHDNNEGGIQKVTVQVQQVEKPVQQKVQRILISSLVSASPAPTPDVAGDFTTTTTGASSLFANSILSKHQVENCVMPVPTDKIAVTKRAPYMTDSQSKTNHYEKVDEDDDGKINNFQSALINQQSPVTNLLVSNRNGVNNIGSLEELLDLESFVNSSTPVVNRKDNQSEKNLSWPASSKNNQSQQSKVFSDHHNQNSNKSSSGNNNKRHSSSKSFLQWISFGKLGSSKNSNIKNSTSANNNKAQKRSSCPPLGHPLLLNGIKGNSGITSELDSSVVVEVTSDHLPPSQVISLTVDTGSQEHKHKGKDLSSSLASKTNKEPAAAAAVTSAFPSDLLPPKPTKPRKNHRSHALPRLLSGGGRVGSSEQSDDEFSVNFERIIEGIFDANNAESNKMSLSNNPTSEKSKSCSGDADSNLEEREDSGMESMEHKIISLSTTAISLADDDANKFDVVEKDREDVERDSCIEIPEVMLVGGGGDGISRNTSATSAKSATIPVVGKPPKPPSSASKYYGLRPGSSSIDPYSLHHHHNYHRRHHHLHLSHPSEENSSTRQAMLELAQKLVSFREELHRSREHIASSHQQNLDEIHVAGVHGAQVLHPPRSSSSFSSTTGIDPYSGRRSLPHSRHPSTSTSISTSATNTPPLYQLPSSLYSQHDGSSIISTGATTTGYTGAAPSEGEEIQPVTKSVNSSRFLQQDWDKCVLRAKENFTRRGVVPCSHSSSPSRGSPHKSGDKSCFDHHHHPVNKNGNKSRRRRDPSSSSEAEARAVLLETDLDFLDTISSSGATENGTRCYEDDNANNYDVDDEENYDFDDHVDGVDGNGQRLLGLHGAEAVDKLTKETRDLYLKSGRKEGEKQCNKATGGAGGKGYYSCSLQNLSSFGEGESVVGVRSSQEIVMATLQPGEYQPGAAGVSAANGGNKEDRSRSMEFLLDSDSDKNAHLRPPENTLKKAQQQQAATSGVVGGERRMSEHELRIQRSLQKLNVPDWYKSYATSTPTSAVNTPSKSRTGSGCDFGGSGTGLAGGWPGLGSSSKTNSLTSLQSARYSGSKSRFGDYGSRHRVGAGTGGVVAGGTHSSLMSPSSTASASPSPNFERSSFTYGMPYALTRFAAARMSCGASPASLSPSPSPVGGVGYQISSTSTPVSSGPASSRYHGYQKQPYLGWRSQERLSSKSMYRSPSERLAADHFAQQKAKTPQTPQTPQHHPPQPIVGGSQQLQSPSVTAQQQPSLSSTTTTPTSHHPLPTPEIEVNRTSPTTSNVTVTSATASDLSLNNSEESNSHKLNRVRSSIKEVSNAIVDYVNESKPLDDGMNGRSSPRRGLVWLESSFVGTKPIDSPGTPDTPSTFMHRSSASAAGSSRSKDTSTSHSHFRFDTHELASASGGGGERMSSSRGGGGGDHTESSSTSHYTSYISRNEQMVEERSNSSSVSSPTLEDILDSLLALRRPNKKFRSPNKGKGHESQSATSPTPPTTSNTSTAKATAGGDIENAQDISTASHYYSTSTSTPPSTAATYGSSSAYKTEDITDTTGSSSPRHHRASNNSPPQTAALSGGGGSSTSAYQHHYHYPSSSISSTTFDQPTTTNLSSTTTSSEIYSKGITTTTNTTTTTSGGGSSTSAASYRSYQSDWQDRMNQSLPDATFSNTSSYGTSIPFSGGGGIGGGDTFSSYSSSRYSTGGDPLVGSPSSAVSSLHSTPTHQQYNRQSSSTTTTTTSGGGVKDKDSSPYSYYSSSSCHSSPAKSILGGSGGDYQYHRSTTGVGDQATSESNELLYQRRSIPSSSTPSAIRDPEEEDELAFGNPTEILRSGNNNISSGTPSCGGGTGASSITPAASTVAPLQGGVIVNPLTGLSEYSNPPTPARHRRVSFDLDFSDKEEKSSSRSKNKEENVGGTIQCRNTKCAKTATGLEARREFKVCHNCNAYYCSRECRRAHWEKHKKTCMQSRVGAICKQIISHVKDDSYVMNQLSTTAKRGFLAKGRGTVKLFFNSPDRAERFLTGGLPELPEPLYIPVSDMLPEEMGAQTFSELSDQCRSYNTETRFVLYACVCVVNEVPTYGAVKWERELISRCSKLRLLLPRHFFDENQRHHHAPSNPAHHLLQSTPQQSSSNSSLATTGGGDPCASTNGSPSHQPHPPQQHSNVPLYDSVPMIPTSGSGDDYLPPPLPPPHGSITTTTSSDNNDTLILRSVPPPSSHQLNPAEHKRLREVSFANIQKHLLLRGVDIKKTYPDIFSKLCRYVERDEPFLPVTIYPKNQDTGGQFVCVIMPECSETNYSLANQEATIAAAVASAAAYSSSFVVGVGPHHHHGVGGRPALQRVETINISEPGDFDDDHIDLT